MYPILKIISKGDYYYALCPSHPNATKNGYVLLHRVLEEYKLGRLLRPNEDVHHINGDKKDNRPENRQVIPHAEHAKLHRRNK